MLIDPVNAASDSTEPATAPAETTANRSRGKLEESTARSVARGRSLGSESCPGYVARLLVSLHEQYRAEWHRAGKWKQRGRRESTADHRAERATGAAAVESADAGAQSVPERSEHRRATAIVSYGRSGASTTAQLHGLHSVASESHAVDNHSGHVLGSWQ